MPNLPQVYDVTAATFQTDVVEASRSEPVVVDFWAAWCGPCRTLGPILERLAQEENSGFRLAKVDTQAEPDLAAGFGVSSIPHVAAVRDGQIISEFVGLRSEAELRTWLSGLRPSPTAKLLADGRGVEASDPAAAEALYRQALALEPSSETVQIALAGALVQLDRLEEARSIITALAARGFLEPEAQHVQSLLDLRTAAAEAGGVEQARRTVAENPGDWQAKIALADALAVAGSPQEALDILLDVIQGDRAGYGDRARASMVQIFELLGHGNPLATEYRRKLATALY